MCCCLMCATKGHFIVWCVYGTVFKVDTSKLAPGVIGRKKQTDCDRCAVVMNDVDKETVEQQIQVMAVQ